MEILYNLMALVTVLTIKHFLADFTPLQTHYMLANKGKYGHWGGISHSGIHALLSFVVLFVSTEMSFDILRTILYLSVGEFLVHYHMDWFKENYNRMNGWKSTDYQFWILFGVDQLVHHLTYVAMILIYASQILHLH